MERVIVSECEWKGRCEGKERERRGGACVRVMGRDISDREWGKGGKREGMHKGDGKRYE